MTAAYRSALVGQTLAVLFEQPGPGGFWGHAPNYVPVCVPGEDVRRTGIYHGIGELLDNIGFQRSPESVAVRKEILLVEAGQLGIGLVTDDGKNVKIIFVTYVCKLVCGIEAGNIVGDKIGNVSTHLGILQNRYCGRYQQDGRYRRETQRQFCLN